MAPKQKKGAAASKSQTAKRARKPSSKVLESATIDSSNEEDATTQPSKVRRISWTTARTERLLDWLEENPVDRQKLFSDSTKDAKEEGRRKRVAKGTKSEFHKSIAKFVFSVDDDKDVREDFAANAGNYTKSVDNYLGQLRKEYRIFNEKLGQTGAGLRFEDVEEGSNLLNLIQQLEKDFPFWKRLHGFWRMLPNFNPYTASSEPGQDLAADALALIQGRRKDNEDEDEDDAFGANGTQIGTDDDEGDGSTKHSNEQLGTPNDARSLSASPISTPTPVSQLHPPLVFQESKNLGSAPTSRATSTSAPHSKASTPSSRATSMSQKVQGKRSRQEAFADENRAEAEILATLAGEKHARKMAEHAQRMCELDIKKQRMDLDANEKRLQAEDRRLAAQHQREREKEAHDLQMFRLRLQYQGAGAVGTGQFGAHQFGDSNTFGGATGSDTANLGEGLFLPPFNGP